MQLWRSQQRTQCPAIVVDSMLVVMQGGRNLADTLSSGASSISSSSSSSGHRQLQHTWSSTEWRPGSGSMSGSTVESGLALFAGKKVLLVEVCDMVRLSPKQLYVQ